MLNIATILKTYKKRATAFTVTLYVPLSQKLIGTTSIQIEKVAD